jgi:ribose transport system substrate-binding protein
MHERPRAAKPTRIVPSFPAAQKVGGLSSWRNPCREPLRLAVIPKDGGQDFWRAVYAGASQAADQANRQVIISWRDPASEDDYEHQEQLIDDALADRVAGIVLAPINSVSLVRAVHRACRAKVPVLIIDSALHTQNVAGFIGSDNFRAGILAARELGRLLRGKGKVLLLRLLLTSASTEERAYGFLTAMKREFPEIKFPARPTFAGGCLQCAVETSRKLLRQHGYGLSGIFAVNEIASSGMLVALQEAGLARTVKFIGFDADARLRAGLNHGEVHRLVLQDPFAIGYLGVKTLTELLSGTPVASRAITGTRIIPVRADRREYTALIDPVLRPTENRSDPFLSKRESEVLHWVRQGKRDSEIACILAISIRTVQTHVFNILRKLGVETRTAAAMYQESL